jgi:putative ABC transport system ATP-binding protein
MLVEIKGVTKTYQSGDAQVNALDNASLNIEEGDFTVLVGPSGSGKTTMLNHIGCLDRPTSGDVIWEGQNIETLNDDALSALRAARIGFIFQSFHLVPVLTALENVMLAWQLSGEPGDVAKARQLLVDVDLADHADRKPNQLSGGQQQRVAIARALIKDPKLVIADEPTANLDSATGEKILALMRKLNEERGTTFLFSTHDERVMNHAKKVYALVDGVVQAGDA